VAGCLFFFFSFLFVIFILSLSFLKYFFIFIFIFLSDTLKIDFNTNRNDNFLNKKGRNYKIHVKTQVTEHKINSISKTIEFKISYAEYNWSSTESIQKQKLLLLLICKIQI